MEETKQIPFNPASGIKAQKIQNGIEPRWLNRKERSRFTNYWKGKEYEFKSLQDSEPPEKDAWKYTAMWKYRRNMVAVYTMLLAGLRISEVVALDVEDIDRGFVIVRNGKGGKSRMVPMNSDLTSIMNQWLKEREQTPNVQTNALFLSQKGGRWSVSGINNLFETIWTETSLQDLTPHVMRHTFCHNLAERGTPIQTISDIAGHQDIKTTRLYIASSEQERTNAVKLLETGEFN